MLTGAPGHNDAKPLEPLPDVYSPHEKLHHFKKFMLLTGAYSWHPSTCHTCLRHFMNFISPQWAANNQIHSKIHENETQIYTRERKTMIEYYGGHESESLLTSRFVVVVIDVAGTAAFTAAAAVCNYSR